MPPVQSYVRLTAGCARSLTANRVGGYPNLVPQAGGGYQGGAKFTGKEPPAMPRGPVPLQAHQTIEPFAALLLIAAPWIFGFSDNDTATTLSVIVGVIVLITGMTTRWRMSLVKLIPLRTHFMMDLGVGIALIVLPFVAGFSDHGGATRFFVIAGVLELGTALMTRWDEREEVGPARSPRTTTAR
jgi:hypothetical protein